MISDFIFNNSPLFYLGQSVWRDEAFSFFMARPDILKIIAATASDFNPPLYYIILHFWMKLAGRSDEMLRLLSFIFHLGGVYFAYMLASKITMKKERFILPVLYFFNPMLLFYSFEMRMYSLFAMLSTGAIYYFYSRDYKKYIAVSALGLYSHSFFVLILASLTFYNFIKKESFKIQKATLMPLLFFLPWIPVLAVQFSKSKESWLYPVDRQLIFSALGNLFTAYEGTPGHLWGITALLSAAILAFLYLGFKNKKIKGGIFLAPLFVPLILILGYSYFLRPLYVNRYLIFITVFEVTGIFAGIMLIKNRTARLLSAAVWLSLSVYFDVYFPPLRHKTDFKTTFGEINLMAGKGDYVFARTPISYLESAYYYKYPENTYVYNPDNIHIPNYIGVNVIFPDVSRNRLPSPARIFMIKDNGDYDLIINRL